MQAWRARECNTETVIVKLVQTVTVKATENAKATVHRHMSNPSPKNCYAYIHPHLMDITHGRPLLQAIIGKGF